MAGEDVGGARQSSPQANHHGAVTPDHSPARCASHTLAAPASGVMTTE